jgi:hypothetical protein
VGFGRLAALLDTWAHRLILQSSSLAGVARSLARGLESPGAACIVEAHQACLRVRGEEQRDAVTHAEAYEGVLRKDGMLRRELWARISAAGAAVVSGPGGSSRPGDGRPPVESDRRWPSSWRGRERRSAVVSTTSRAASRSPMRCGRAVRGRSGLAADVADARALDEAVASVERGLGPVDVPGERRRRGAPPADVGDDGRRAGTGCCR